MRSSTIKDAAREAARGVTERAAEQAQIDQLRERLAPVVEHAIGVAREQAAHAAIAAGHAKEWAAPRVGAAVERGRLAAAPTVEAAAERVAPAVDAARDRIVEDLLPRLVEAVHNASVAGAAARVAATESVSRTVEDAALSLAAATPTARARVRRRRRARILWLSIALTLLSAGIAAAVQKARSRQAAWELAPTEVPTTMDVVAAAAGPSDAGIATADSYPTLAEAEAAEAADPLAEPTSLSTTASGLGTSDPATSATDEPVDLFTPGEKSGDSLEPSGPETVGIDSPVTDQPTRPRGGRR